MEKIKDANMGSIMKILWVTPLFQVNPFIGRSGPVELCQRLVKKGHEVFVVTLQRFGSNKKEDINGVEVFRSPCLPIRLFSFKYQFPVRFTELVWKTINRIQPAIINYHTYHYLTSISLPVIRRQTRIPCVLTTDGFPGVEENETFGNVLMDSMAKAYSWTLGKRILSYSDKVIITFPSHVSSALRLKINEEKIRTITWGVDSNIFRPFIKQRTIIRKWLGVDEEVNIIMFVGRFTVGKGLVPLVQAFTELKSEHQKNVLVLVGDGPLRHEIEKIAKKSQNKILFTGWQARERIPKLLAAADIFVLPSLSESGGGSAMEACSCGIPVIASKVGGIKDYIIDGKTGILVPPGDKKMLKEAMEFLIKNPRTRQILATNAKNLISINYNWNSTIRKYEEIYENLSHH